MHGYIRSNKVLPEIQNNFIDALFARVGNTLQDLKSGEKLSWHIKKQRLERALVKIITNVNTWPRGFGLLPENKGSSLNGYFNFKPSKSQLENKEWLLTDEAKEVGIGNNWEANLSLYYQARQCIEDNFYKYRHLYQGDPKLEARALEVKNLLDIRESYYHSCRVQGCEPELIKVARELDEYLGAPKPDGRFLEAARSNVAPVLDEAKRKLGLDPRKIERLKVYFMERELYLISEPDVWQDLRKEYVDQARQEYYKLKVKPKSELFISGVGSIITEADRELGLGWDMTNNLKVFLVDKNLYIVPRDQVLKHLKSQEERNQEFYQSMVLKYAAESVATEKNIGNVDPERSGEVIDKRFPQYGQQQGVTDMDIEIKKDLERLKAWTKPFNKGEGQLEKAAELRVSLEKYTHYAVENRKRTVGEKRKKGGRPIEVDLPSRN